MKFSSTVWGTEGEAVSTRKLGRRRNAAIRVMIDSVTENGLVSQVYFIGIESMFAGYWLFGKSAGRAQILFGRLSVLGFAGDKLLLVGKWQVPNKLTLLEERSAQPHGCTISVFLPQRGQVRLLVLLT